MGTKSLTNMGDTVVFQGGSAASKNYYTRPILTVRTGGSDRVLSYIAFAGLPTGPGVVIQSAKLRLFAYASAGSATITAHRVLNSWTVSGTTWTDQPSAAGTASASRAGTLVKDQPIELDLTSLVTSMASGAVPNFGIRLDTTATTPRHFHSANAPKAALRPVLVVTFTVDPSPPTGFVATGGKQASEPRPIVPWDFADESGGRMVAYQLQSNSSNSWTAPTYDSGEVASGVPEHEWHTALADGQMVWYRVRHKSSSGRWSKWSDGHEFGRTVVPDLSVTSPAGGVVNDVTPPVTWSFEGTQSRYWVQLFDAANNLVATTAPSLYDEGWVVGTASSWAPARPVRVGPGYSYHVMVVDDVDRVVLPNDFGYAFDTSGLFEVGAGDGVGPVTGLVVERPTDGPSPRVSWSRSATPDGWVIERRVDDHPWRPFTVDVGDTALGGNAYEWVDATAPGRHDLTYRVRPVVNGVMGTAVESDTIEVRPLFIYLVDPDDPDWFLPLAGQDEGTWTLGKDSAVINVLGSDRSNIVHEGVRGYEGSVSGDFADDLPTASGLTAQQLRDRAWRVQSEPTTVWRLVVGDMNLPVALDDLQMVPVPGAHDQFGVSVAFYQQGEVVARGWVA